MLPFVVHCVRVPLTGTTMAVFAAYGSVVGTVLSTLYLLCVQYCRLFGGPLLLFFNGPTSWQCSHAYMFDLLRVHVIILFGDCSVSLLCPNVLRCATPFGGGATTPFLIYTQQIGFGRGQK